MRPDIPPPIPDGKTAVDSETLSPMLLCAFRYTLGRMTYQVSITCQWLERYWDLMAPYRRPDLKGGFSAAGTSKEPETNDGHADKSESSRFRRGCRFRGR